MKKLQTEIRIALEIIKMNILAEMQLRGAFFIQIVGMMINDISFVLVWVFFFHAFGTINGWSTAQVIGFQGVMAFSFGIAFGFMKGSRLLPEMVSTGAFDHILLSPRSIYARILTAGTEIAALGDMAFGAILIVIYIMLGNISFLQMFLLLSLLISAVVIMINVGVVAALISFFIPDSMALSQDLFDIFMSPAMYPSVVFPNVLRFIFIFIIPSLAVGGLPVEIIENFTWTWYAVPWLLAIFWMILAMALLNRAVRRYESGNLTGARV